ncbi:hypothetical protein [Eubacterium sp.]|uniref:hypothetical protein n=1 Tax=Eubacterium sp. TaxID=142586 RepID=UPI0039958F36
MQSVEKPTLLLAVPGSGNTTVLITRLEYMIYCIRNTTGRNSYSYLYRGSHK